MKTDPPNTPTSNEAVSLRPNAEAQDNLSALLSDLEGKARAATKGPWQAWRDQHGEWYVNGPDFLVAQTGAELGPEDDGPDAAHIAAFDPDTCLALVEVARRVAGLDHVEGHADWHFLCGEDGAGGASAVEVHVDDCPVCALARLKERSET